MKMMQEEMLDGARVLDVGTGSGILALCASKLGAHECYAYDIDPIAVRVAQENVEKDGAKNVFCGVSDLLSGVDLEGGKYDFVLANIVSDIILRLLPDLPDYMKDGGRVILSGIIGDRVDEIRAAVLARGLSIVREESERDWFAILAEKV
jgi:ribosomal protein L11 methyltransferase